MRFSPHTLKNKFQTALHQDATPGALMIAALLIVTKSGVGQYSAMFETGSLEFEGAGSLDYVVDDRLSILAGSLLSAIFGVIILSLTCKKLKLITSPDRGSPINAA